VFELKKLRLKGFSSQQSDQMNERGQSPLCPLYSPHRESAHWGVRDPDMSSRELDKSRKSLESGPGHWTSPVHQDLVEQN
jgi:hypothetical protein